MTGVTRAQHGGRGRRVGPRIDEINGEQRGQQTADGIRHAHLRPDGDWQNDAGGHDGGRARPQDGARLMRGGGGMPTGFGQNRASQAGREQCGTKYGENACSANKNVILGTVKVSLIFDTNTCLWITVPAQPAPRRRSLPPRTQTRRPVHSTEWPRR